MNPDEFGINQTRIIQQLERRIADLEAQVRQEKGTPIVQASQAFRLPPVSTPAAPASGAYLYATSGGEARWRSSTGADYSLVHQQGVAVPNATFSLFNPPASYSQAQIQTYTDTLESLRISYQGLLASLRGGGIIAT
ncbi:hypothetical protein [Streptosporangium sp. NPDC051022]|uniref:hypothetical protein n=1 Tax=Streptosporangium sp. NPDC051022 TaxID=3155752 RepID=UPI0034445B20